MNYIQSALNDSYKTLDSFLSAKGNIESIDKAVRLFISALEGEGRILSCGNGGSMCDSMHFVEELTGRYRKDRRPLSAISMGDPSHITCVANDYGYDHIFERHVEAWGRKGDTLLAISTSGNSPNVLLACEKAKSIGMNIVALTGKTGGKLKDIADVSLIVESPITDRIQEVHIKCIHIFIEGIERHFFPEHYS